MSDLEVGADVGEDEYEEDELRQGLIDDAEEWNNG